MSKPSNQPFSVSIQPTNSYVKLYLLPDRSKSGKRKSSVHRNELNPKFDEKFTFGPLQLAEFEAKILWLSVWHKDRLGRSEFLGELLLPLGQVRQQLLSSDLNQSTPVRWYQLCERVSSLPLGDADWRRNNRQTTASRSTDPTRSSYPAPSPFFGQVELLRDSESASQALVSRQPSGAQSGQARLGNGSAAGKWLAEQQQVDRLSELRRKADLLATTVAPPRGPHSYRSLAGARAEPTEGAARVNAINASPGPIPKSLAEPGQLISGQLFVALKFVPHNQELLSRRGMANMEGELQLIIKEAHNIGGFEAPSLAALAQPVADKRPPPSGPLPNPFCKCYLLDSNGQRVAKQRTPHLKRTANPRWDHKCLFDSLKLASLSSQAIEIQMFNRGSILVSSSGSDYLGGIRLCRASSSGRHEPPELSARSELDAPGGAEAELECSSSASERSASLRRSFKTDDSNGSPEAELCSDREARLWNQMLTRPNIWVYGELRLRPLAPLIAGKPTN